jgi:Glycosyltransferases, probably involved in cell wall biogenesis
MMSTYNGEKYIEEQIVSNFSQKGVEVDLYVRDDGSKDGTFKKLEELKNNYSNMSITKAPNVGYAKSFFSLLAGVPNDYKYYAFSDQDDVWKPNKLLDAVKVLEKQERPALYSCNLELVDQDLKPLEIMEPPSEADFQKGRYLIDRYSYGCTMVFNSQLRDIAIKHIPTLGVSHDNWLGLIAIFCGEFIFDEKANILYRQHENNVTGGKSSVVESWKRRIKNINRIKDESKSALASELLKHFEIQFDEETKDLLYMVAEYKSNFKGKMKFFFDKRTVRRSREKNMIFRMMILLSIA